MKYKIGNTVINSDHIVSVEYQSAGSGIDYETGQPYSRKSLAQITTTAVERDTEYGFEGRVDGVGTQSTEIVLRGNKADRFWELYSADAIDVMAEEQS